MMKRKKSLKNQEQLPSMTPIQVLHETQKRQFCGLHTINNLLQLREDEKLDVKQMDLIADEMFEREQSLFREIMDVDEDHVHSSWFCFLGGRRQQQPLISIKNNHRSKRFLLGSFGNYSFEVISEAVKRKGFEMKMIDTHEDDWDLDNENVRGLIINTMHLRRMKRSQLEKSHLKTSACACFPFLSFDRSSKAEKQKIIPQEPATQNKEEFVQAAVGGHWFSIGKVYVNAKSYHEQANEVSTPVSDEKKPDATFEAVANETEIESATVKTTDTTLSNQQHYWFNHDSTLRQAVFLKSSQDVIIHVRKLALEKQIICWKVLKAPEENQSRILHVT